MVGTNSQAIGTRNNSSPPRKAKINKQRFLTPFLFPFGGLGALGSGLWNGNLSRGKIWSGVVGGTVAGGVTGGLIGSVTDPSLLFVVGAGAVGGGLGNLTSYTIENYVDDKPITTKGLVVNATTGAVLGGAVPAAGQGISKGAATLIQRLKPATVLCSELEHGTAIWSSGRIFGKTEGSVYAMGGTSSPRWLSWRSSKKYDPIKIVFEDQAAQLFKRHEVMGPYSFLKWLAGQYKAPLGDVVFDQAFKSGNVIVVTAAHIAPGFAQALVISYLKLAGRRGLDFLVDLGISAYVAAKATVLWHQLNDQDPSK